MMREEDKAKNVEWPVIRLKSGAKFTLRLAYSAYYTLTRWGKNIASATALELGAAMAGSFDGSGKWNSAGFKDAIELADLMEKEDEPVLIAAVSEAIKKVYPETEISTRPAPGTETSADSLTKIES